MKTKHSGMALTWLVTTLLLTACGGGGSSTPAGSTPAGNTPTYTLSGQFQKGPFAIGSQISVNELDENLNPTGKVYNVQTSDDLGNFTVGSDIGTHLVEIVGSGFYMDELTGNLASSQVQIRAVADLGVDSTPTVNILTALQSRRLKKLITQGSAYAAANTQSQNEVLTAFGIDPTKVNGLSTLYSMKINGSTDADSVLLAVSTILSKMATNAAATNATTQPAELSNYINTIAAQLENTGTISTAAIITDKNLAATQIDLAAVRTNVETYYANRGVTVNAPKFEEWLDKDGSGILPRRLVPTTGLSFTDQSGVEPNQAITSNEITINGLGTGIVIPVTAGANTTIIKNGSVITGNVTTTKNGDTIALRGTSSGYGLTSTSTITAGSSSTTWRYTSKPLGGTMRVLTGTGLVLQNNSADDITITTGVTSFNFNATLANGATYSVTVKTQPTNPAQICSVANGTGTVGAAISDVIVSCAGPVSGLAYTDVTGVDPNQAITSNAVTVSGLGTDIVATVTTDANTTIIKNGTAVTGTTTTTIDGDTIALRVTSQGYGLTNTSTITIASSTATWRVVSKPLGGTIRVLTGTSLVLQNNGADNITIPAGSTSFNFTASLTSGSSYNVTVLTQPTNPAQVCTVANGTGTVNANPSNIIVSCAGPVSGFGYIDVTGVDPNQTITSNIYTVSGLGSGIVASVTADANTSIIKNGTAVSGTTITAIDGDTIALRVTSLGYGLTSTSTITIASSSATWLVTTKALSGTISGLTSSGLVLQNNAGDNINIAANATSFIFPASVANGVGYSVSVFTQPTNPAQVCAVANGIGTVGSAISSVIVSCSGPVTVLSYSDVTGVDPMQTITSNAVTVSGLGTGISANVTVDANTTIIKNGTVIVGTTTSAVDGDTFALRVVSLGFGQTKTSTISFVSYSTANWNVTSKAKIVTFFQGSATSCSSTTQGSANASFKYIAIPFRTDQVDFISNTSVVSKYVAVGILTSGATSGPLVPSNLEIQTDLSGSPSGTLTANILATNGGYGLDPGGAVYPTVGTLFDRLGNSYIPNRIYIQGYFGSSGVTLNQNTNYWLVAVYSALTRPDLERCGSVEPTAFGQTKISTDGITWTNAGVGYLPKLMLFE